MKPIWAHVDQASDTLMLMRVVITSAAMTAVAVPASTSSAWATGTASIQQTGSDVIANSPAESMELVRTDLKRYGQLIRALDIRAD